MDTTILDKTVKIPGQECIKIRELIKKPMVAYITSNKSKKTLVILTEILSKYNLVFGMNDFDLKIYKINSNSIFFTIRLKDLLGDKLFNLLKKRGIYTLLQLVLTDKNDLMKPKKTGIGFVKSLSSDICEEINNKLFMHDLKLGMSKNKVLEIIRNELIERLTEAIKKRK